MNSTDKGHEDAARALATFTPSKGDEEYLQPAGSLEPIKGKQDWTKGLSALSLSSLDHLANDIAKVIDQTHKAVAKAQIKVGKYLLEARREFPGDLEFGQWRKAKTPIQSQSTAYDLMRVAETFKNAPALVEACSFSVLKELVYCPPEVVEGVAASAEVGGPTPTVAEARKMKKAAAGRPAQGSTSKKGNQTIYDKPKERDPEDEAIRLVQGSLLQRLNHNNPYVRLGLYPFGGPPNIDVLEAIEHWHEAQNDKNPEQVSDAQLAKIYDATNELVKEIGKQGSI